uniref:Uncharacterized protein n=1 Tax=Arundo donax TaxID=35708 RepID=A0A0A9BE99_ARUDO
MIHITQHQVLASTRTSGQMRWQPRCFGPPCQLLFSFQIPAIPNFPSSSSRGEGYQHAILFTMSVALKLKCFHPISLSMSAALPTKGAMEPKSKPRWLLLFSTAAASKAASSDAMVP